MPRRIDLTGQKFGRLTVVKRVDNTRTGSGESRTRWLCKCDCGVEKEMPTRSLLHDNVKSCGCLKIEARHKRKKNLLGKRYGRLLVMDSSESRQKPSGGIISMWRCKCDCGNECVVSGEHLRSGHTSSCGCLQSERTSDANKAELAGKRFGKLFVLGRTGKDKSGSYLWRCKCECGNEYLASSYALASGHTRSCGCIRYSLMEFFVGRFLKSNLISFDREVRFEGLIGMGGKPLSYDFGVYDSAGKLFRLIECQGQQHFFPIEIFGGLDQFVRQQLHDDLKREYAANVLHVPLIKIPYSMTETEVYEVLERMIDEMEAQKTKETHIRFNPGVYEGLIEVREEFGMSLSKIVNLALTDNLNRFARKVRFADKKQAAEINASVLETQKSIEQIRVNLSRIGSNLNQIAKLEHIKKKIAEEEARPRPIQNIIDGYRNDAIKIEQQINAQFNADDLRELVKRFEEASERFGEAAWRIQG